MQRIKNCPNLHRKRILTFLAVETFRHSSKRLLQSPTIQNYSAESEEVTWMSDEIFLPLERLHPDEQNKLAEFLKT